VTDSANADHPAPERRSRRALIGAGVTGAALAVTGSRAANASADESSGLSDEDLGLADFAIGAELAANELYAAAVDAGASDEIYGLLGRQHRGYAERIAGLTGVSANTPNEALIDSSLTDFENGDPVDAALALENTAAATHIELLKTIVDPGLAGAIASITAMESRHAVALATKSGQGDDLDVLFDNDAAALSPEG